jgi:hypothetical protein
VSREILIIETDEFIDSNDLFTVLMTLTEMGADSFVMTGRVLPTSSPLTVTEMEIRRRFYDEYSILGSNIHNLFEGIRMGFVNPVQAPVFVEQVVELAHQGRDRLIAALIDRDEDFLRAISVFGNYLEANSNPRLDNDGRLRRVGLIDDGVEHPVYRKLESRYAVSRIESIDQRQILWLRTHEGNDIDIPLDRNGNIITPWNSNFRRVDLDLFIKYELAARAMHSALEEANELRAFSQISPDRIPLFIADNALLLLDELLESPNNENRSAWIMSRTNYFNSLDDFFNSPEAAEEIFASTREIYTELKTLHTILKNELAMSLCIIGPPLNSQYSALLANALITGSHIKPVNEMTVILWSIIASLAVLFVVFLLRPLILLPLGLFLSIFAAAVFGTLFIFSSYWIDPIIVLYSSSAGIFVLFLSKSAYLRYRARAFRMAYRTCVSKDVLKTLITAGRPGLSEVSVSFACVIAIRDFNLLGREGNEKSQNAGKARRAFYAMARREILKVKAVIAGFEGDTVFACFGSPLVKSDNPTYEACAFVGKLLKNEKILWRFGIDSGECAFFWSPETGFSVNGRPAIRAKVLASRTARFQLRALITDYVRVKTGRKGKKIGTLYNVEDAFFEFTDD